MTERSAARHVGVLQVGEDDWTALIGFAHEELERPRGALVILAPRGTPALTLRSLESHLGRSLTPERDAGRVVLVEGESDPDAQLGRVIAKLRELIDGGAEHATLLARVAWGEPGWPAPEDVLWMESRFSAACADLPVTVVCMYDVTRLPGVAVAFGTLEIHRTLLLGGRTTDNALALGQADVFRERLVRLPWLVEGRAVETRGIHACAFFADRDEEYAAMAPIIHEGVDRGDASIQIVDAERRADHVARLAGHGIDTKRLDVRDWQNTYLQGGRFDADRMLATQTSLLAGRGTTRLVADMGWALTGAPGVDQLIEYESRINDTLPPPTGMVVCTYDSVRFTGAVTIDVLRAHPYVILNGTVQENPLYTPTAALLEERSARKTR